MPENAPLKAARFWQEAYLAAIRGGQPPEVCLAVAQKALNDYLKLGTVGQ